MHPSFLSPLSLLTIYSCIYNKGKRIDFSPHVSDLRELSVAHLLHSQACHTHAWPKRLNSNMSATALALYTTPHALQRPARLLVPLHTPTNPAHPRCVP